MQWDFMEFKGWNWANCAGGITEGWVIIMKLTIGCGVAYSGLQWGWQADSGLQWWLIREYNTYYVCSEGGVSEGHLSLFVFGLKMIFKQFYTIKIFHV